MSPRTPSADFQRGIRAAIAWLHEEARSMNDPHARAVLNSAGFHLGLAKLTFVADGARATTTPSSNNDMPKDPSPPQELGEGEA